MIPAGPAHAAVFAALHAAGFPPAEHWDEAAFATQLAMPGVIGLLAEDAAAMVLARAIADEAEILTIAVAPSLRRRGLGRLVLDAAAKACRAAGAEVLYLEVSTKNAAACALYGAAGFETVARRVRYYPDGADALVMRRQLTLDAATGS